MQKKIISFIILFIFFISCESKKSSLGDINEVTIISSNEDKVQCQHIVEYFFNSRSIMTPQEENVYSINWARLDELDKSKLNKNLLFLSLDYPVDSTIDILVHRIMKKNNITDNISSSIDLFAKKQKVLICKSTDTVELEKGLSVHFPWIASEYNHNIYSNYYEYIRSKGRNSNIESFLADQFNISMFIQEDYELIQHKGNFAWIGRGYPYRWIIFYKLNKSQIDTMFNPYNFFEHISESNDIGISIYDDYRKKTILSYNQSGLYVYRGIYSHQESQTGGPFALYLLDNMNTDEVILVASTVNNPGNSKMPHLLQMDALIKNIKFLGE